MPAIKQKLRVVELYAGTGRSIEPFRGRPEFEVALLADISHKARAAYIANHSASPYALLDLEKASAAKGSRKARGRIISCSDAPPAREPAERTARDQDPRNEHIVKFAKTIRTLKPIGFAMENVPLAACPRNSCCSARLSSKPATRQLPRC